MVSQCRINATAEVYMTKLDPTARPRYLLIFGLTLLAACATPSAPATPIPAATAVPATAAIPAAPTAAVTPTLAGSPPRVGAVVADRAMLGRYERIELTAALTATYDNPYDQAQVALSASFQAPSGAIRAAPGFWDGRYTWKVRFTPDEIGAWRYTVHVRDRFGTADSSQSSFDVTASDRHGWLQIASWHDPQLSPRYLVYHDGTPRSTITLYATTHTATQPPRRSRATSSGRLRCYRHSADPRLR
jgi:hypothetical protein